VLCVAKDGLLSMRPGTKNGRFEDGWAKGLLTEYARMSPLVLHERGVEKARS
jgi:hypothetical protein